MLALMSFLVDPEKCACLLIDRTMETASDIVIRSSVKFALFTLGPFKDENFNNCFHFYLFTCLLLLHDTLP